MWWGVVFHSHVSLRLMYMFTERNQTENWDISCVSSSNVVGNRGLSRGCASVCRVAGTRVCCDCCIDCWTRARVCLWLWLPLPVCQRGWGVDHCRHIYKSEKKTTKKHVLRSTTRTRIRTAVCCVPQLCTLIHTAIVQPSIQSAFLKVAKHYILQRLLL